MAAALSLTARPGAALTGSVPAPGDKSVSHRALILGGIAIIASHQTFALTGMDRLELAEFTA